MVPNITYDISDLYNFIDGLADISALVWVQLFLRFSEFLEVYLYMFVFKTNNIITVLPPLYMQLWSLDSGISAIWSTVDKAKVVSTPEETGSAVARLLFGLMSFIQQASMRGNSCPISGVGRCFL